MLRRASLIVGAVLLTAIGTTVGASGAAPQDRATVSYRGVEVRVPSDWPVVDLERDTGRCARFDINVVYLGRQSGDALCPALIVGAAEAVQLEPWTGMVDMSRSRSRAINGEPAHVDDGERVGGRVLVGMDRPRVMVRVAFGNDEALANEIIESIRVRDSGPAAGAQTEADGSAPPSSEAPHTAAAQPPLPPSFTAADTNPAPLQPGIYAGEGFDTCANPTLTKMEAWLSSPYRAIGIYVGGINHGCKAQTLDAAWVADTARLGWSFIPIYVGRQAPCHPSETLVKIDPGSAATQGTAAADDAIAQADKYGLPTGSPLYNDMEAYSGPTSCKTAVHTFLQAWTLRLHARGYTSGVYSSEASGVANLSAAYDDPGFVSPDVIWTAHWGESKRIFGHNQTWLPDNLWKNHQRLHQYQGGHIETWGGQAINIDNDLIDAPAVRFAAAPRWLAANFNGTGGTDLVHLCCGDYANTWLSNGDGTFAVKSNRPWPRYGVQPGTFRALDYTGDGKTDLIHQCCTDYVHTWISDGDGTYTVGFFRPWPGYGMNVGSFTSADVNNDGKGDLIHLCCKDYANVWLSNGNGTFTVKLFRPWPGYGMQVGSWVGSDVDGDGDGDLVHLCCKDYANVWLSRGDGTYSIVFSRPWPGYGLQVGRWGGSDVNGDGKGDLVHLCCSHYLHTWLSNGDGTYDVGFYQPWPTYGLQAGTWFGSDRNGDGKGDLVHLCCPEYMNTWTSNGDGTYNVALFDPPGAGYNIHAGSWLTGDADADGDGDLFHLCCPAKIYTWFAQPDGTYQIVVSPV